VEAVRNAAWRPVRQLYYGLLGIVVLVMILITAIDVTGRYVFNAPLAGTQELTEILLALLVFGGAPLVTASKTEIATHLFEGVITGRVRRFRDRTVAIVSAVACSVLGWRLLVEGERMSELTGGTPQLGIPIPPILYFAGLMALACALLSLVHLFRPAAHS
jgi:TRAP-type C4-dicarboxylate transport system permease small subunit